LMTTAVQDPAAVAVAVVAAAAAARELARGPEDCFPRPVVTIRHLHIR
jgi:hypothetical protein